MQRLNGMQEIQSVKAACETRIEIKERKEQQIIKEIKKMDDVIQEMKRDQQQLVIAHASEIDAMQKKH